MLRDSEARRAFSARAIFQLWESQVRSKKTFDPEFFNLGMHFIPLTRGLLLYRLLQQAVAMKPVAGEELIGGKSAEIVTNGS
jgi:hypothetical protein